MAVSDNQSTSLLLRIKGDAKDALRAFAESRQGALGLEGAASNLTGVLSGLSGAGTGVAGALGGVGIALGAVAGVGVTVGKVLFDMANNASQFGSEIYNASVKTGLGAESISALKLAADRSGVSLESVTTIVNRFSRNVGEAAQKTTETTKTLRALGIEPKKAIDDLDGSLAIAFKRLSEIKSPIERATVAQQLFGRSGTELLKVIDDFNGDLPAAIENARRLGLVMSDKDAKAADEFGDQMDTLGKQLEMVKVKIGVELMPVFLQFANEFSDWLAANKGEVKSWATAVADAVHSVITQIKIELNDLGNLYDVLLGKSAELRIQSNFGNTGIQTTPSGVIDINNRFGGESAYQRAARSNAERARQRETESRRLQLEQQRGFGSGSAGNVNTQFNDLTAAPIYVPVTKAIDELFDGVDKAAKKGAGKAREAKKTLTEEMESFFDSIGAHVTQQGKIRPAGTRVKGTNRVSYHAADIAAAVDVRTRDKSIDEIVGIIFKAFERGYRVYDERLKQGQPHLHFEDRTGRKDRASTFYGDASMYGGQAVLDALKKADVERMSKKSGVDKVAEIRKQANDDAIDDAIKTADELFRIRELGLNRELEKFIAVKETEKAFLVGHDAEILKIDAEIIEKEIAQLDELRVAAEQNIINLEQMHKAAAGNPDALEKITKAIKDNAEAIGDIDHKQFLLRQKRMQKDLERIEEIKSAWLDMFDAMKETADETFEIIDEQATQLAKRLRKIAEGKGIPIGRKKKGFIAGLFGQDLEDATGHIESFEDVLTQLGNTAMGVFMEMGRGLGDMVGQWVLMGDQADVSMRKMVASVLAGVAAQAATLAVFHVAMGIAALTPWGAAMYGPAVLHFKAAAVWAGVAVGAALLGRAVAGDSFKRQTGSANASGVSSSGGGSSSNRNVSGQGEYYSSYGDKAYIQEESRNAPQGIGVQVEISFKDKPKWFGEMFKEEWKANGRLRRMVADGRA